MALPGALCVIIFHSSDHEKRNNAVEVPRTYLTMFEKVGPSLYLIKIITIMFEYLFTFCSSASWLPSKSSNTELCVSSDKLFRIVRKTMKQ